MRVPNLIRNRPKTAIIVVAAVVILAGVVVVRNAGDKPSYQTAAVTKGDLEVAISASGKVQPKNYVDVGAQVSGQLEQFYAEIGDYVEKGQLLAQIDETIAATKVEADRAQLKETRASYAQQEATLELARANAARAEMLYAADAISQAEYQAAIADRKVAQARLTQLEAQIERQNSTLEADLATLEFTKIYAPISGTVVSQTAVEGQTLNANQTTPTILRIADLTVMTVEAEVSEADVLRVKKDQEAYFTTLGGDEKWESTVRQVLPQPEVLNDVVLYKVLLDVENHDEILKPEMTAQVFFVSGKADDAILAPVAALRDGRQRPQRPSGSREREGRRGLMAANAQEPNGTDANKAQRDRPRNPNREAMRAIMQENPDAERKMVLVMRDGKPVPQPVLVGIKNRTQAEILYGLDVGDELVIGEAQTARPQNRGNGNRANRPPGMGRRGPR